MSTTTSAPSSTTTKRLLHELHQYNQARRRQQQQQQHHHHPPISSLPPRAAAAAEEEENEEVDHIVAHLGPLHDDDLTRWTAILKGPRHTPYEGGRWQLAIDFPGDYPLRPPRIRFVTRVCGVNVNFLTGEICLDLLTNAWTPAYTILHTLAAVQMLLVEPVPDSPLNVDLAALWRAGDRVGWEALVRYFTAEEMVEGGVSA